MNLFAHNTAAALAHSASMQRRTKREATWDDVADAYDEGLRHAISRNKTQQRYLRDQLAALRVLAAVEPQES